MSTNFMVVCALLCVLSQQDAHWSTTPSPSRCVCAEARKRQFPTNTTRDTRDCCTNLECCSPLRFARCAVQFHSCQPGSGRLAALAQGGFSTSQSNRDVQSTMEKADKHAFICTKCHCSGLIGLHFLVVCARGYPLRLLQATAASGGFEPGQEYLSDCCAGSTLSENTQVVSNYGL